MPENPWRYRPDSVGVFHEAKSRGGEMKAYTKFKWKVFLRNPLVALHYYRAKRRRNHRA